MTDQQPPRPPLWQAMQGVYYDTFSLCKSERQCRAAEILVVRDYLINHSTLDENTMDLLADEAQRAEVGE